MGSPATPPPGGTGPSVTLVVDVDTTTGTLKVKGFGAVLGALAGATTAAGGAASGAGAAAGASASGWMELFAQTELVKTALEGYIAVAKSSIVESTLIAARTEVLNTTLAVTAKNLNYSTGAAMAQVEAVRKMNITHQESINLTLQFMRAQLELSKTTNLARAAQDLAAIAGENSSQTAGNLIEAIQSQNVLMLRQYGIVTHQEAIYERYAATLNRSAASLTEVEKRQAFLNRILFEAGKISGAYVASMEDAGKKLTSLDRVFQDAKEHIGEAFLPVMNKVVDALAAFGKWLSELDPTLIRVVGGITAVGTVFVTLAGTVYAATKALAAFRIVMTAATASAGPWIALATVAAGVLVTLGMMNAEADALFKKTTAQARVEVARVEQAKNLRREYDEYVKGEDKLSAIRAGRQDFTQKELTAFSMLTEQENRRYQLQNLQNEQASRYNNLVKNAEQLHSGIVTLVRDASTGEEKRVLNMQKAKEYQESEEKAAKAHIEDLRRQAEQERQKLVWLVRQHEMQMRQSIALREFSELMNKVTNAVTLGLVGAPDDFNKGLEESRKKLTLINEEIKKLTSEASGMQNIPLQLSNTFTVMNQGVSFYQQMLGAYRQGVKALPGEMEVAMQGVTSSGTAAATNIANVIKGAVEQRRAQGQQISAEEQKAADMISAEAMRVGKSIDDNTSKMRNYGQAAKYAADETRRFTTTYGKDLERLGIQTEGLRNLTMAGLASTAQAQAFLVAETERLINLQERRVRAEKDQATVVAQNVTARRLALAYEMQAFQLRQRAEAVRDTSGEAASTRAAELAAFRLGQARKLYEMDRDLQRSLVSETDASHQKLSEIYGASADEQIAISRHVYAVRMRDLQDTYAGHQSLHLRIVALNRTQAAEEIKIRRGVFDQQTAFMKEFLALQQQRMETSVVRGAGTAATVQGLDEIAEYEAALDKQAFRAKHEGTQMYLDFRRQGIDIIAQYEEATDARVAQARIDNALRVYDARVGKENEFNEIFGRADIAVGHRTREQIDLLQQQVSLHQQIERLKIQFPERARELAQAEANINAELRLQSDLRKAQLYGMDKLPGGRGRQMDAARQAMEYGASVEAVRGGLAEGGLNEAIVNTESAIESLNQRLEDGHITLKEYSRSLHDITGQWTTFPDMITNMVEGMASPLDALKGSLDLAGEGLNDMFDAMLRGESASQAMRNAISRVMASVAKQELMEALRSLAYGFAALTPFGAAVYGPASQWFIAAGMHGAAAAAAGALAAVSSTGGGGGGTGGGPGASTPQITPINTRTNVDDNIVRLEKAVMYEGTLIAAQGTEFSKVSRQFIESMMNGQFYTPVTNAINESIGPKLESASRSQQDAGRDQALLLRRIHAELVRANEQGSSQTLNMELSLEGQAVRELLEGGYVRSSQKYSRETAASVRSAQADNFGRRDVGRLLGDGGV